MIAPLYPLYILSKSLIDYYNYIKQNSFMSEWKIEGFCLDN